MQTTKELATRVDMPLAEFQELAEEFKIDKSDILIPKILLMQPSSELVADGKATIGDFRNSVSGAKVGTILEPFLFIPFHYNKIWDIVDADEGNKWLRSEPFKSGADEELPWEFEEAGKKFKRIKRVNLFGLMPKEVEQGNTLPLVLSFKSTGYREGTKILTQMQLNLSHKKLPWNTVYAISGEKRKNEDNQTYCVPKVEVAGEAHEDHLRLCMEWYKQVKSMAQRIVVDESDVTKEAGADLAKEVSDTGKF